MNTLIKKWGISLVLVLSSLVCVSAAAAKHKKNTEISNEPAGGTEVVDKKDEARFPIGCRPVGYAESLKIISLFPGKEGALQSMYFFFNQRPESISLYQMRDKDSEYSTRYNHSIKAKSWAVLATGEPLVKFICTLGEGKSAYGQIVDCAETVKICEYVNVKFGLNNKGNFWIVDSNTRNGAVSQVVHYGIIPGV